VEIVVAVGMQASGSLSHDGKVGAAFGTPAWIGRIFLVDHLFAFEITSVVLLVAAVGGVILGSHTQRMDPGTVRPGAAQEREPEPEAVH
jgi:NADH:ubiquinone oxidoreductase subunit 6 (subunit J)